MKRLKIMGVCVTAVCVVGLITGGAASAASYPLTGLPEVGRCVKSAGKHGLYKFKNCVKLAEVAGTGAYEWEPGPGALPGFNVEASEAKLETVSHVKINCASSSITGAWTGSKTATVKVELRGCASAGRGCGVNPGKPTEITNEEPLEGELGFVHQGEHPKVGLDLKPKAPSTVLFTFTCGGPPELTPPEPWVVEGSIIGKYRYIDARPRLEFGLRFEASGGKQIPQQFEGGLKDTPIANRLTESGPVTEEAGLTLADESTWILGEYEEPLEVKGKV
jgi:hypothetical protein